MTGEPARSTCSGIGSWPVSRGSNLALHKSLEITVLLIICLIGHWFKMSGSEWVVGIQLDKWGCQAVNFPEVFDWSKKHISELSVSRMVTQGTNWKFVLLQYVIEGKCNFPIEFVDVFDTTALFLTWYSFSTVFLTLSPSFAVFFVRYRVLSQCPYAINIKGVYYLPVNCFQSKLTSKPEQ